MKTVYRFLWLVLFAMAMAVSTFGCYQPEPEKPCPDCRPRAEKEMPKNYSWRPYNENQDELVLEGKRVGVYDRPSQSFTEWTGTRWGRTGLNPPICCPIATEKMPTGLDAGKLTKTGEHFALEGREVSRENALEAFQGPCPNCPKPPKLEPRPDGTGKARLTVISSDSRSQEDIRRRWFSDGAFYRDCERIDFWACGPGHWSVEEFPRVDGQMILQDAGGAVIHRQENLDMGNLAEAIRRKLPYDPRKDVDAGKGLIWWVTGGQDQVMGLVAVVVIVVLVLIVFVVLLKGGD